MPLDALQARFRQAVTGRDDTPLMGLLDTGTPGGIPMARRIAVHRNTYFGSLTEALSAAFPVVEALVGCRFHAMAARAFIEANPPARPDLTVFGAGFADFLRRFPPAASVPYLGDVAALEWARVEATFAAEATPIDPSSLARIPPERMADLRFVAHPSARLVSSPWSIQTIWNAHRSEPVAPFDPNGGGEAVLVVRPHDRMRALVQSDGAFAMTAALLDGATLGEAAARAMTAEPTLDLQAALATLLESGALIAFTD